MLWLVGCKALAWFDMKQNLTRLGLMMRLHDSNGESLGGTWQAISCGAVLGVADFNARNGRIVPELASLDPSSPQIATLILDSNSSARGGIEAYRAGASWGAAAFVGPAKSATSQPVASLASIDEVPVVSFWASAPHLANNDYYSYFSRVYPSDSLPATAIVQWAIDSGWHHLSILTVSADIARQDFRLAVEKAAAALGMHIHVVVSFDSDDAVGARAAVRKLTAPGMSMPGNAAGTPANVILLLCFDEHLEPIITEAHAEGLFASGHVWLTPDVPSAATAHKVVLDSGLPADTLLGFRSLYFSPLFTPGWARLSKVWASLGPADCANDVFSVPADEFLRDPDPVFAFAYDAAVALALAMKATAATQAAAASPAGSRGASLLASLRAQRFDGATGPVAFDAIGDPNSTSPGERTVRGLDLVVFQWNVVEGRDLSTAGSLQPQAIDALSLQDDRWTLRDVAPGVERIWLGGHTGAAPPDQIMVVAMELERSERINGIILAVLAAVLGLVLGIIAVLGARYALARRRQHQRIVQAYLTGLEAKLDQAIASTSDVPHAAALIAAADFMQLGELRPHEELRDRGLLQMHDRLDELERAPQRIIFFSHQWTSREHPDRCGTQYRTMRSAIEVVIEKKGWDFDHVFVWCDYCSIPQRSRGTQKLAIESLTGYASVAHAFIIIAPPLAVDGMTRDVSTYNRRMWCRAENLAFSLRNGVDQMWVATGPTKAECVPQSNDVAFMESNLRVFQGEATDERDKLSLVVPILGLYAELYSTAIHLYTTCGFERLGGMLLKRPERQNPSQSQELREQSPEPPEKPEQPEQPRQPKLAEAQGSRNVSFADVAEEVMSLKKDSAQRRGLKNLGGIFMAGMLRVSGSKSNRSASSSSSSSGRRRVLGVSTVKFHSIFGSFSMGPADSVEPSIRLAQLRRRTLTRSDTDLLVSHSRLQVLKLILGNGTSAERDRLEQELFPSEVTIVPPNSNLEKDKGEPEMCELFGPLIRMMQERLHEDVTLREKLVAQAKRHRKAPTAFEIDRAKRCAHHWRTWARRRASERVISGVKQLPSASRV